MRHTIMIITGVIGLMLCGCSETKYVPEGQYLLNRVKVESDGKYRDVNSANLKSYVRQKGNTRWFSSFKLPLSTYSLAGKDSSKWINRTLKNIGEAPVIYDTLSTTRSMQDLQMRLQNMGYLRASVDATFKEKKRKINVTYHVHPREPYYLGKVNYEVRDTAIANLLRLDLPEHRGLKENMRFSVENLDNERNRLVGELANRGYFRFNKDFITFRADSIPGEKAINLTLVIHANTDHDGNEIPHLSYRIGKVNHLSGDSEDSIIHLRKGVLQRNTFIRSGELYSAKKLQDTYAHFGRLGAVKYTSISWEEHQRERLLDCNIHLSTNKPSTISFQPEGTNTAGDFGAAVALTYQNRNLFKGAENLTIELRGAFEAIKGLEGYGNDNFEEYSVETKLTFPRFIAPFLANSFRRRINATSEVSMLYDLQNRPEFHRRVFSVAWKYKWNDSRHHDRYRIDLLDLNYISMPWISETFRNEYLNDTESKNAILRYNYENLFIMKIGMGYTYNNGRIAIKANAETAGNLLHGAAHALNFHKNAQGQYTFLDIAYAQYVKGDVDFTRNIQLDYNNQLVFHAGFGIAYPYGNSTILPFEKRYFAGGANSVRGWSVRGLGPGSYISKDGRIDFINQTGDMKLDLNMEYRTHLFWKIGGALFVDAGNIWTIRSYDDQPGGQFKFDEFLKQLAVSYGMGFRLNFGYFILRFDMGMKAVNPAYTTSKEHYPLLHPDFSRDFAFHFAVGLPF